MLEILGLATLVMLVMVLRVKGPQGLAQYDTHYSPEKRLSIDYLSPSSDSLTPLNITETETQNQSN